MIRTETCPRCGAHPVPGSPGGLCPSCLLRGVLQPESSMREIPTAPGVLETLAVSAGPMPRVLLRDTDPCTESGPVLRIASDAMREAGPHAGRLQLLGEIARGGMGAVLKGRDADLGRDLAVKVLLERHADDPALTRRFVEEAQIAGQLQHPGVVPVHELGTLDDRRPYFAMKLVKGRTLAEILDGRSGPATDLPRLVAVFLDVAQTVAYAHARGVIHRDLKPSNVMVGSFGEVQVMDWGLAKVLAKGGVAEDRKAGKLEEHETVIATARSGAAASGSDGDLDLSHAGSVLGTPSYMAPEQARGENDDVDERADVFALGSILVEILTGVPAFSGRTSGEILRKSARGDLAEARARLESSGADSELVALALDCVAGEAEDRPRDASGVVDRLTAHLSGVQEKLRAAELARAAESARAEESKRTAEESRRAAESAEARAVAERRARRLTAALAASVLGLAALGGLGGVGYWRQRQARSEAVARALGEAESLLARASAHPEDIASWREAEAAAGRVDLAQAGDPSARDRLAKIKAEAQDGRVSAERDAALLRELVAIRGRSGEDEPSETDAAYARAFREAGLDLAGSGLAEVAARLKERPPAVGAELASYLDHWADVRRSASRPTAEARAPLDLARAVDPDPFRDRVRALLVSQDGGERAAALRALADDPRSAELPPATAVLLAQAETGLSGLTMLRKVVARHPEDLWANFMLAQGLESTGRWSEDAIRYYTAARAIRPESASRLARLLDRLGRLDEAEATWRDLAARRPDDGPVLTAFGAFLRDRGRAEEASAVLKAAEAVARKKVAARPDDASAHYQLAEALDAQGRWPEAVAAFREAIRLKPDLYVAHGNLGNALNGLGRHAEAAAAYREALRLLPGSIEARGNLGNALNDQGRHAEAEAVLREAIRLRPDFVGLHVNLASALNGLGRHAEAEAEAREAIRLRPDHAKGWISLGLALAGLGKRDEAVAAQREAIRLEPGSVAAHTNLGNALGKLGKHDEAIAEQREAIRLRPDLAVLHNNLGMELNSLGRHAEAEAALREAIRLKPDDHGARGNLGNALNGLGRHAEAAEAAREAIRLRPDEAQCHEVLGNALAKLGQADAAIASFREAIRLKPDDARLRTNFGNLLKGSGRFDEAIAEQREAIRLKPSMAAAHYNLGFALRKQGKPAEAEAPSREAVRLAPDMGMARLNLANTLMSIGKSDEAVLQLREAIRLQPDDPNVHYNLANTLKQLDRTEDAIGEYREAIRLKPDYAEAHCNLGLILGPKGRYAEALALVERGHVLGSARPDWRYPSANWVRIARRFVEAEGRLPAVLKGDDRPRDEEDRTYLQQAACKTERNAAAARLLGDLIAANPSKADDLKGGFRFHAAEHAALAGVGQGQDAPADEAERARLRALALGWLDADLILRIRAIAGEDAEARNDAVAKLGTWKTEADFAGVRDPEALARLPEAERAGWAKLWAEVDAQIGRGR